MRHAKKRLQFNRFTSWRKATLASLARSVLVYQSIRTTKTKAQAVKPLIEKLISLAKQNTLAAKRQAYGILNDHQLVSLLFSDIGARFAKRVGGYVRILSLGKRRGDNAELVILELTEIKKKEAKKHKKEKEIKEEKEPQETSAHPAQEKAQEQKAKTEVAVKEKPPTRQKPTSKFLGGIRSIFKKERDSL
jgi:large subunit ribosomal protein L17